ncbi:hypothetical protein GPECTOR_78g56 [Gonium pectorale]|uniref:Uncharacterized protein n=1 Tax=Gonium pectorale TaxID=33097 RepID=A0A150G203_GONPE|nr:hypothetical protein GPECTOR_78g56 [Gonium pectorale]|eukprot:KXZ43868.1 hypothetical protein GPECTOR_78g56 [Gonium pectorale]
MTALEMEAEELGYHSGRTGSNLLRSFTSRMSTMLGLAPAPSGAGTVTGTGAASAGSGSRGASSRVRHFLRASLNTVGIGKGSVSHQGYGNGHDGDLMCGQRQHVP